MWENVTLLTEVEHIVRTCSSFFSIRFISDYQMDNYQLYHSETKCPNYWPDLYQTKNWATGKVFRVMKVYDICDRCKCLSKCIENLPISSKILKQDEFRNIERDLDLEFPHEGIHNGLGQKLLRHWIRGICWVTVRQCEGNLPVSVAGVLASYLITC